VNVSADYSDSASYLAIRGATHLSPNVPYAPEDLPAVKSEKIYLWHVGFCSRCAAPIRNAAYAGGFCSRVCRDSQKPNSQIGTISRSGKRGKSGETLDFVAAA
jgi:hypothetical protein